MRLTVEFLSPFSELAGSRQWQLDLPAGADVGELLEAVFDRAGAPLRQATLDADGGIAPGVSILVNGRNCAIGQGLATSLTDGSVVHFLVHIAGGAG